MMGFTIEAKVFCSICVIFGGEFVAATKLLLPCRQQFREHIGSFI